MVGLVVGHGVCSSGWFSGGYLGVAWFLVWCGVGFFVELWVAIGGFLVVGLGVGANRGLGEFLGYHCIACWLLISVALVGIGSFCVVVVGGCCVSVLWLVVCAWVGGSVWCV